MLVIRLWNYFRGYVIIRVEGLTLEKFINLAIARNIYLWDIVRSDYTTLEAKVSIKGFKALKPVVKRVGCRINIITKNGYPFFIHKFKYRKMFAFGFVVAVSILFFLTSFIWSIDIQGNERISKEEILNKLEVMGIDFGTFKRKIDVDVIKKGLLTNIESLSFARVEIKGTKLLVEIKESDLKPDQENRDYPCHIIAKKKAVIEKIIAKNGKSIVEKGDIVKEGQILISGIIDDERLENPLLVHSEGEVLAKTWYNKVLKEPIVKEIKEETGKVFTTKEIKFGSKGIQLINGEIPFSDYVEEINHKKVLNWKEFSLPLEIVEHKYKEVEVNKVTRNIDSLKKMTSVKGVQELMEELPEGVKVISKDVKYLVEDNILTTTVSVEVIEDIGDKYKITTNDFEED
ncbi:sporulation protein YqfD [Sporosalibacterium faouarense]|uniref:sporulation protein YqfD n=1 Tax=Sporosalibacterium faouarense TaxID=516123 RepID=UPI00141D5E92|nr:sporulation protein YqfD [Sporosalibacterium faouarense]MTI49409.1 sporulation protein YqfD [Bacillota bacterium]